MRTSRYNRVRIARSDKWRVVNRKPWCNLETNHALSLRNQGGSSVARPLEMFRNSSITESGQRDALLARSCCPGQPHGARPHDPGNRCSGKLTEKPPSHP